MKRHKLSNKKEFANWAPAWDQRNFQELFHLLDNTWMGLCVRYKFTEMDDAKLAEARR